MTLSKHKQKSCVYSLHYIPGTSTCTCYCTCTLFDFLKVLPVLVLYYFTIMMTATTYIDDENDYDINNINSCSAACNKVIAMQEQTKIATTTSQQSQQQQQLTSSSSSSSSSSLSLISSELVESLTRKCNFTILRLLLIIYILILGCTIQEKIRKQTYFQQKQLQLQYQQLHSQQQQQKSRRLVSSSKNSNNKIRILYIVTTLSEYNTGSRNTKKGSDRYQETTIPIIKETITKLLVSNLYIVDVYLICHYTLSKERQLVLQNVLSTIEESMSNTNTNQNTHKIKLSVWNDATPLGYDTGLSKFIKLEYRTLHLARQHRFVIKDNILNYNMFVNFEDDMLITDSAVTHYIAITNEIEYLKSIAPSDNSITEETNTNNAKNSKALQDLYYGPMTKGQLDRVLPGFMRVEVLLDEEHYPAQSNTGPVPVDLLFDNNSNKQQYVNSTFCCSVSKQSSNTNTTLSNSIVTNDKLLIWETNILPLGVRQMPFSTSTNKNKQQNSWLNWVVTLRGPNQNNIPSNTIIGDYWSNKYGRYYNSSSTSTTNNKGKHKKNNNKKNTILQRPQPLEFKYINNQGGWMGTIEQIIHWNTNVCAGGFLPPYNSPHYMYDGLDQRNVEWYSGGMQLSTVRHACNMQRIIQINDATNFSKSLLYHTANNKQKQLTYKRESMFIKANTLLGQLNTIKKHAEHEIPTTQ